MLSACTSLCEGWENGRNLAQIIARFRAYAKHGGWKMKRATNLLVLLCLGLLLAGCGRKNKTALRVVTQVDVACDRGYQVLRRQYTQPEKVSMVLNYLRLQKDLGPPERDPESAAGDRMQIDVTMSDGSHRLYYQHCGQFLSEKNQNWHEIDPKLALDFDLHLQMIPTDQKPPAV